MKRMELQQLLNEKISSCNKCELHKNRIKSVPGEGNLFTKLMILGEGPGFEENKQGKPFVGICGQLLNNTLKFCGIKRENVFICNVVKCRPPENRTPLAEECQACAPYLDLQIKLINPKLIITLGSVALNRLLPSKNYVTHSRGKFYDIESPISTKIFPTFHPSFIIRKQEYKDIFVKDFMEAIEYLVT